MSTSREEFMAAAVLSDDDDPTRLSWEEVEESWGSWYNFMGSYCLKPWDQEDCEEALAISRALKMHENEEFLMDVIDRLTNDKDDTSHNQASGGATKAVTFKDCEEALAINRAISRCKEWKDEQERFERDERVLLDGIARLGLDQDNDESSSAEASGGATKAVTDKDLPEIGKWINWYDGEEFIAEVLGYEDDCQDMEKFVKVKLMDRKEYTAGQTQLEECNWSYCEAPTKQETEKAVYKELNQFIGNRFCLTCNCKDKQLQICTGCYKVYYCDATCQIADWDTHENNCMRERIVLKPNPRYPLSKVSNKVKKSQIKTQEKYHQIVQDALDGNFTVQLLGSNDSPVKNPKAGEDLKFFRMYRLKTNNGPTEFNITWQGLEAPGHSIPKGQPTSCYLLLHMGRVLSREQFNNSGLHLLAQSYDDDLFWDMIINFNTFGTVAPFHGPCDHNPNNVKAQMPREQKEQRKKWNKIFKRAKDDVNDVQCMFSESEEGCHNFSHCPYKHDIEVKKEMKKRLSD